MTVLFKLPIMVLLWAGMFIIKFLAAVTGLFAVAVMWKWRHIEYDIVLKEQPWTIPWLNPEDWAGTVHHYASSLPKWWVDSHGISFKSFYHYHAIRNPGNGLRNIEGLDLDIVPSKVRYRTNLLMARYEPDVLRNANTDLAKNYPDLENDSWRSTAWYLAWQGFQAGFKLVHIWNDSRHLVIKIGWRVEPASTTEDRDIAQVLIDDASFASKVLVYRKG